MSNKNNSNGIGFGTLLFLTFLILKLTNTIDWSWWWVFSPLWIPIAVWCILIIFVIVKDKVKGDK